MSKIRQILFDLLFADAQDVGKSKQSTNIASSGVEVKDVEFVPQVFKNPPNGQATLSNIFSLEYGKDVMIKTINNMPIMEQMELKYAMSGLMTELHFMNGRSITATKKA